MNIFVQSPDAAGQIDGSVYQNLLRFLPNQTPIREDSDVVIVPISRFPNFTFNQELYKITNRPVVIIDFMEYEWCFDPANPPIRTNPPSQKVA